MLFTKTIVIKKWYSHSGCLLKKNTLLTLHGFAPCRANLMQNATLSSVLHQICQNATLSSTLTGENFVPFPKRYFN